MKRFHPAFAAWGLAVAMVSAHAQTPTHLLGSPAGLSQATRTIVIAPGTKHVNVTQDDIVKFAANGREFAFKFDGPSVSSFDLQRVAPAGVLDRPVIAYVAPNTERHGI